MEQAGPELACASTARVFASRSASPMLVLSNSRSASRMRFLECFLLAGWVARRKGEPPKVGSVGFRERFHANETFRVQDVRCLFFVFFMTCDRCVSRCHLL